MLLPPALRQVRQYDPDQLSVTLNTKQKDIFFLFFFLSMSSLEGEKLLTEKKNLQHVFLISPNLNDLCKSYLINFVLPLSDMMIIIIMFIITG